LLETGIESPRHRTFPSPFRLTDLLTPGRPHTLAPKTMHVRRRNVLRAVVFECLPEALQLENQRFALRTDAVAAPFAGPARCVLVIRSCMISVGSHD
jgi:hypothetical protein